MRYYSHNFFVPGKTVCLSPLAIYRDPGQITNASRSAVRALHILEILATAKRSLRAIEISVPLGLSPSSANQLLKTMMDAGYLIFDPLSKRYCPSPRVSKLGASLSDDYFGADALDALMRSAQKAFGGPITLTACQGSFMQVLEVLWPQPSVRLLPFPGKGLPGLRVPLFGSCTGAAWLSCQDEVTIRAAIRLCRRELGQEANKVGSIIERLYRFREQGYAFGGISLADDYRGFAIPFPPASNGIVLVMAMIGRTQEMEGRQEEMARVSRTLIREHLGPCQAKAATSNEAWAHECRNHGDIVNQRAS